MKILVDAMGGDNAPESIVKGAIDALAENKNFTLGLVGDKAQIEGVLSGLKYDENRVEIIDAPDVITCEEEPTLAIRSKPNSSLCVSFKMLKENQADALVSAGSTGAVLVGATLKLGRIKGVNRPALCPLLPTAKGDKKVILLDAGANADCKAINLVQFSAMGSAYAKILGVENPTVALLSNGTEDKKGNALTHEVFPILKNSPSINFVGNTEARDILSGDFDVIVTDGFSGNVAIKSMEGAIGVLMKELKGEIYSTVKGKIGGLFLKKGFKKVYKKMDYTAQGGAIFLGVSKVVVKSHGSSKEKPIKNSVLQALALAESRLPERIDEELSKISIEGMQGV